MAQKPKFGNRLVLTTALAGVLFAGYGGRSVVAGTCAGAAAVYNCGGAANSGTDVTQSITYAGAGQLIISTYHEFGIDTSTSGGNAIYLSKSNIGGLDFTDNEKSSITGANTGLYAKNYGDAALSITTTGAVTGNSQVGIYSINYSAGTDLTIDASGTVTGYKVGILGVNSGAGGDTTITTTAAVTSIDFDGIVGRNGEYTANLTIYASGTVTGYFHGIHSINYGTEATTITTTAAVIGNYSDGIFGHNYSDTTDLTIDASGNVTGGNNGIRALNRGSGATTIITTAVVTGSSNGVLGSNHYGAGDLIIYASGSVTGDNNGIWGLNYGSGATTITTSAAITGGNRFAISTTTGLGRNTIINLNSPTIASSTSGQGIYSDAGDSTTTVASGAAVQGAIELNDGSDYLTFSGGDFTGVTILDGGDDADVADGFIDTLTFAGSSGVLAANDVTNWENIIIEAGSTIVFDGVENLITPNLSSAGEIDTQDGVVGDSLTLTGDFTGGGTLSLDTVADNGSGGSDVFIIQGDLISGTTGLDIANIGGTGGQTAGDGILVVQVAGNSPADSFSMTPFSVGGFEYTLVQTGANWYLQSTDTPVPQLIFTDSFESN